MEEREMSFTSQRNFKGKLDGTTVHEINKKVDFKKTKLEDRKQVVENILGNTDFYSEYFDGYFKSGITSHDFLSQENNVCRSLDRMATYLLTSDEIKAEEEKEKTEYVFYSDERYFQKKVDKERSVESLTNSESNDYSDNVIHFLKKEEGNKILIKGQSITSEDLEREDWLGEVLRSYKPFLDLVTEKLKNNEDNRFILSRVKGQLQNDMIYSKDALLGVFGYNLKYFSQSTEYDIDVFDFTNPIHLKGDIIETESGKFVSAKGLLFLKPNFDPNDDFSFILLDLKNTIEKANLTDFEKEVLRLTQDGLTQDEIAENLETYQMKISRTIDRIVKKVISVGEKYDAKEAEI
jgi:DNA-binding CsgD family transcriptional regulator